MKRYLYTTILLSASSLGILPAQRRLESGLNLPRTGDEILKQEVRYKDPGRSGEQVIWDFSRLESINEAYTLDYSAPYLTGDTHYVLGLDTLLAETITPEDQLFIGTEHYTHYYYLYRDSLLWTLGHENATNVLHYPQALLSGKYPAQYKDKHCRDYTAQGLYSRTVPFETRGRVCFEVDACGTMLLPSGDTLHQVIRTTSSQVFSEYLPTLTGAIVDLNTVQETSKWYSPGYRYPIFETIRTRVHRDTTEINRFETAFFYPPGDHYYLDDDAANRPDLEDEGAGLETDPWAGLTYNVFPNPVRTYLDVEIYLPRPAEIRLQIRSTMGFIALEQNEGSQPAGLYAFRLNLLSLPVDNYVLNILINERLLSEIIMKR